MSYVRTIRELVSKMAVDVLPEQVFVQVDTPSRSLTIKWRNSTLLSDAQRAAIVTTVQTRLPESIKSYRVSVA